MGMNVGRMVMKDYVGHGTIILKALTRGAPFNLIVIGIEVTTE